MIDKDRLAELIKNALSAYGTKVNADCNPQDFIADFIVASGVTVGDAKIATTTWISVEERLPEDREWVLVWHTGYKTPKKAFHKADLDPYLPIFRLDGDNGIDGEVTHWMPLPQSPKEVE